MNLSDLLTDFRLEHEIELRKPHAISVHINWLNWSNVGDLVHQELVGHLKAKKLGEFERPGDFYNFVIERARSITYQDDKGNRHMEFPNSKVYYARRDEPLNDLLLLNLLEPHLFAEIYADRVVALMKRLNVTRYIVAGAMGSSVPHTRPIVVNGRSNDDKLIGKLGKMDVYTSFGGQYKGPTSIFNTISQKLQSEGITTVNLVANMPTYLQFEEGDYNGVYSVIKVLSELEDLDIPVDRFKTRGLQQYGQVNQGMLMNPQLRETVQRLELFYDRNVQDSVNGQIQLPPNIEEFLRDLNRS